MSTSKQGTPPVSSRTPTATVRGLPRQLRNFTVLTACVGLLVTAFNGVMLLSDPTRNALHLSIVLFLFACMPFTSSVMLRRGDTYIDHRFWEFPIIVGLALAPAYAVAFSMGMVYLLFCFYLWLRHREARATIPRDFGAASIAVTFGCYLGTTMPPISLALGAIVFTVVREVFTVAYDWISVDRAYAIWSMRSKGGFRLLVSAGLSIGVTALTTMLGPHREFMVALPVTGLLAYWGITYMSNTKDEKESWRHMESIASSFLAERKEERAITIALQESLNLFTAKKAEIILPEVGLESGGARWTLRNGPREQVSFMALAPGEYSQRPEASRYSKVIDLEVADRALGYMVIEWDKKTPEKRRRSTLEKTFANAVGLSIINTRHNQHIATQADEKAREAARDPLTGLGNRTLLSERGPVMLAESEDIGRCCALLLFDLDGFKRINDTLGHAAGDQVLVEVARRIEETTRREDLAIRLGGDEFAVLAVDMESPHNAERLANKITRALIPAIEVENLQLSVESSIGIAIYPNDAHDIEALLKMADIAMYQAKARGRGTAMRYHPDFNTTTPASLSLSTELRRAIYASDELVLHYQPQVDMRTGEVTGMEGLVRWNHPRHGLLYPDSFVHLAERSNLVRAFTLSIIDQALRDRLRMRTLLPGASVSVNLSAQNLLDTGLAEDVQKKLDKYGVEASELVLEVTETTTVKDIMAADTVLNDLANLGCEIAMDDFGSGYATMESLRTGSPVSEIKIDKGFIQHIDTVDRDRKVARAIIEIAHAWDCRVVAEGIENQQTFEALCHMKCDTGQGYWMHKPAPLEEILHWVQTSTPIQIGAHDTDDVPGQAPVHD